MSIFQPKIYHFFLNHYYSLGVVEPFSHGETFPLTMKLFLSRWNFSPRNNFNVIGRNTENPYPARIFGKRIRLIVSDICPPRHNKKRAEILLQTIKYRQKNIECSSLSLWTLDMVWVTRLELAASTTPTATWTFFWSFYLFLDLFATEKMTVRALVASCLRVLRSCLWSCMWS